MDALWILYAVGSLVAVGLAARDGWPPSAFNLHNMRPGAQAREWCQYVVMILLAGWAWPLVGLLLLLDR